MRAERSTVEDGGAGGKAHQATVAATRPKVTSNRGGGAAHVPPLSAGCGPDLSGVVVRSWCEFPGAAQRPPGGGGSRPSPRRSGRGRSRRRCTSRSSPSRPGTPSTMAAKARKIMPWIEPISRRPGRFPVTQKKNRMQ